MILAAASQSCSGVAATEAEGGGATTWPLTGADSSIGARTSGGASRREPGSSATSRRRSCPKSLPPCGSRSIVRPPCGPPSAAGPVGWSFLGEGLHPLALVVRREEHEERAPLEV